MRVGSRSRVAGILRSTSRSYYRNKGHVWVYSSTRGVVLRPLVLLYSRLMKVLNMGRWARRRLLALAPVALLAPAHTVNLLLLLVEELELPLPVLPPPVTPLAHPADCRLADLAVLTVRMADHRHDRMRRRLLAVRARLAQH